MQIKWEMLENLVPHGRNQGGVGNFSLMSQVCAATFGYYSATIDLLSLHLTNLSHTPDLRQVPF